MRADVEFLASDSLEGRDTGSRGYLIAADYVASQFRAIGLEPAGDKGSWFQQVPFRRASYDRQPVLTMAIGGQQVTLDPGVQLSSVTATSVGGQLNCSITDGSGATLVAQTNNTLITNCTR